MTDESVNKYCPIMFYHLILCSIKSSAVFYVIAKTAMSTSNDDGVNEDGVFLLTARQACHYKKAEGSCSGKYLRYYYDPVHGKCKRFLWTGCIGNGNRFLSSNLCNSTCDGVHGEHKFLPRVHSCC